MLTFVEIKQGIVMALGELVNHKFRSFLTIISVLIGVWSVILMSSAIEGLESAIQGSINEIGSNVIFIDRFPPGVDYDDLTPEERNRKYMTIMEARAIKENCPTVSAVSPENHYFARGGNIVKYKGKKANRPPIVGVVPDYQKVHTISVSAGRFITELDNETRAQVTVIGSDIKDALFPEEDPLGKTIRINNKRFTVVGVREKQKSLFDDGENNKVAIPIMTYMKIYPWDEALTLVAAAESPEKLEIAKEEIISALRKARRVSYNKENDFAVFGQENISEIIGNITKYIYLGGFLVSFVALIVGGIGIMAIMLVSVKERTREIGIRKAIGARKTNIVWQFLIEAMTLSGVGGVLGILIGVGAALLLGAVSPIPFGISPLFLTIGFTLAITVGLIAGVYPAYRAAGLDPIESLQYE